MLVKNVEEEHTRAEIHVQHADEPVLDQRSKLKVVRLGEIVFVKLVVPEHSRAIMYVQHAGGRVQLLSEKLQHVLQVPIVHVTPVL